MIILRIFESVFSGIVLLTFLHGLFFPLLSCFAALLTVLLVWALHKHSHFVTLLVRTRVIQPKGLSFDFGLQSFFCFSSCLFILFFRIPDQWMFLIIVFTTLFVNPFFVVLLTLGEELGWRGFLLPHLLVLERQSPWKASLLVGFVWGLWHCPGLSLARFSLSSHSFLPLSPPFLFCFTFTNIFPRFSTLFHSLYFLRSSVSIILSSVLPVLLVSFSSFVFQRFFKGIIIPSIPSWECFL